jgi:NitT/TauT family transport system substrate-binding protein
MRRRRFVSIAAGAAAAVSAARPAAAEETVSLAIGQKGGWTSMMAQQGVDAGIFKRAGLELKIAYTAGGPDTISAVASGAADVGVGVGTTAVIAAFAKGAPVRIVCADFTGASDIFYYTRPDSPLNTFADVNGRSVAFTRPGSSSFTIAQVLAAQYNLKPNFVSGGDLAAILTQVMSGQLDVGMSAAPLYLDLVAQKKLKIIANGSEAKELQNQTVRVEIANVPFLRDRREVGRRFIRAYAQTQDWMYGNLDRAAANYARYNDMPVEIARLAVTYYPRQSVALNRVNDFERSVKDALDLKFISAPLTADQQKAIFDLLPTR